MVRSPLPAKRSGRQRCAPRSGKARPSGSSHQSARAAPVATSSASRATKPPLTPPTRVRKLALGIMTNIPDTLYGRRPNPLLTVPAALLVVLLAAATGYHFLGAADQRGWSFFECFYFAVISLTTVGYGEVLPGFAETPQARAYPGR